MSFKMNSVLIIGRHVNFQFKNLKIQVVFQDELLLVINDFNLKFNHFFLFFSISKSSLLADGTTNTW